MTKNKRYSLDFEEYDAIWIDDNVENKSYTIRNDTIKEKKLEEIVDLLNEQDQRIQELEESLGFCRDLLDGTCNSTRMKQLHEAITKVVTDD